MGFDGLRRIQEMAIGVYLAVGAELTEVDLLVQDSLPGGFDGEVVLDHRRDEAVPSRNAWGLKECISKSSSTSWKNPAAASRPLRGLMYGTS